MELMDHRTDRLSEYLDDALGHDERRAIEAHLAVCPACLQTLEQLRLVVDRARTLESHAPEQDLWPAVAMRLEPRPVPLAARLRGLLELGRRRFTVTLPQLAGAAAALAVVAGAAVWLAVERTPQDPVAVRPPASPPPAVAPGTTATAPPEEIAGETSAPAPRPSRTPVDGGSASFATFDAARYDAAVAELQRVLDEHRDQLDTATVRILEQNLAIIDRATEEARRALEADPANPYLNGHLAKQMMLKIRVLQRAAGVIAAHS